MPYIQKEFRSHLKPSSFMRARTAGELNFQITSLIIDYCKAQSFTYQVANDVLGALEGAKLEFVRRMLNDYEDEKISLNGDIYGE